MSPLAFLLASLQMLGVGVLLVGVAMAVVVSGTFIRLRVANRKLRGDLADASAFGDFATRRGDALQQKLAAAETEIGMLRSGRLPC